MLHKDPALIAPETFTLLQELQSIPELNNFYLVGGTALTLQLGHRNSIDIDLFTPKPFDPTEVLNLLSNHYNIEVAYQKGYALLTNFNAIKVDFISHQYPIIKPLVTEENITMMSLQDVSAMKLHAISNSGQRFKDFIDIYFLLEHFSMNELIGFYAAKYPHMNPVIALRAVTYFDEIDENIDPPKMLSAISLTAIQKRITEAVLHINKVF